MIQKTATVQLSAPPYRMERRAAVRYRCRPAVALQVENAEQFDSRWARVCNVSTAGIGLLVSGRIESGTRLTVQMAGSLRRLSVGLRVRVVHSTLQEDGNFVVGCVFDRPLAEEEMRELFP